MVISCNIGNTSSNEFCVVEYKETCVAIRIKQTYERQDLNPNPLFSWFGFGVLFYFLLGFFWLSEFKVAIF